MRPRSPVAATCGTRCCADPPRVTMRVGTSASRCQGVWEGRAVAGEWLSGRGRLAHLRDCARCRRRPAGLSPRSTPRVRVRACATRARARTPRGGMAGRPGACPGVRGGGVFFEPRASRLATGPADRARGVGWRSRYPRPTGPESSLNVAPLQFLAKELATPLLPGFPGCDPRVRSVSQGLTSRAGGSYGHVRKPLLPSCSKRLHPTSALRARRVAVRGCLHCIRTSPSPGGNMARRTVAAALAVVAGAAVGVTAPVTQAQHAAPGDKDVTAVMFEWKFDSVAKACTDTRSTRRVRLRAGLASRRSTSRAPSGGPRTSPSATRSPAASVTAPPSRA